MRMLKSISMANKRVRVKARTLIHMERSIYAENNRNEPLSEKWQQEKLK